MCLETNEWLSFNEITKIPIDIGHRNSVEDAKLFPFYFDRQSQRKILPGLFSLGSRRIVGEIGSSRRWASYVLSESFRMYFSRSKVGVKTV